MTEPLHEAEPRTAALRNAIRWAREHPHATVWGDGDVTYSPQVTLNSMQIDGLEAILDFVDNRSESDASVVALRAALEELASEVFEVVLFREQPRMKRLHQRALDVLAATANREERHRIEAGE